MYSVHALLNEVLAHAVHARMSMESLQRAVIDELRSGYRPTHRGHAWSVDQFKDLEDAARLIEASFQVLKGVQFPEMRQTRRLGARLMLGSEESEARDEGTD